MKKLLYITVLLAILALLFQPSAVLAFSSATHLLIAERVFPDCTRKMDLYYGSVAPDLSLYVMRPHKWPTAFEDTHYAYADLRPDAFGSAQKAFAKGWLTHNEEWGADHYAHIESPIGGTTGYVIEKAEILSLMTGLDPEFAHYAIEIAIDLLLKNDDPNLGEKLLNAILFRSFLDRQLLVKVLAWEEGRTDWLTLASAELIFRTFVVPYASALALPSPEDREALAELGSYLALSLYGIVVSPEELLDLLNLAITLCQGDYQEAIQYTILQIQSHL